MAKINKTQRPPFAKNISKRRKELGMSQSELADKIGAHRNTIADIERGVSEGWPDTREAIAKALKCSVSDLFVEKSPSGATVPTYDDVLLLLSLFGKVEPSDRSSIVSMLERAVERIESARSPTKGPGASS